MTPLEVLVAAREKLATPGMWCKSPQLFSHTELCALTACHRVSGQDGISRALAIRLLTGCLPPHFQQQRGLTPFNDAPATTLADVLALFDRAIAGEAKP